MIVIGIIIIIICSITSPSKLGQSMGIRATIITILITTIIITTGESISSIEIVSGLFKTQSINKIPIMGKSMIYISNISIYIIIISIIIIKVINEREIYKYIIILFTILRNGINNIK